MRSNWTSEAVWRPPRSMGPPKFELSLPFSTEVYRAFALLLPFCVKDKFESNARILLYILYSLLKVMTYTYLVYRIINLSSNLVQRLSD